MVRASSYVWGKDRINAARRRKLRAQGRTMDIVDFCSVWSKGKVHKLKRGPKESVD